MIGGEAEVVGASRPDLQDAGAGMRDVAANAGPEKDRRHRRARLSALRADGAGHFVKMVHNGIEYGIMAAYAEGLNILHEANTGKQSPRSMPRPRRCAIRNTISTTSTLRDVAEVWRRGSVMASWLLDLTAISLLDDPDLAKFAGRVSDSGEGRWTIKAAIDEGVPAPVLTRRLYERFSSRGEADFADKLLSAMRFQFGGHLEKAPEKQAA